MTTNKKVKVDKITETIPFKSINRYSDRTMFEMTLVGKPMEVNMDLMKNRKSILEAIATKLLFPNEKKVKTFRQNKLELIQMIQPQLIFEKEPEVPTEEDPDNWEFLGNAFSGFALDPGSYVIGDVGYALDENIWHDILVKKFDVEDGVYRRKSDGAMFGFLKTTEDYCLTDNNGKEYVSDSQTIGLVDVRLCDTDSKKDAVTFKGHVHLYENDDGKGHDIPGYDVHGESGDPFLELRTTEEDY